ncbi:MAG: TetR/AcrR family transcriptional regulator [Candidatus Delongbacteria bacterium]|nr:TetR/AcrR family transcriptional regulator [Candidatus Delongbacteria bacterium]
MNEMTDRQKEIIEKAIKIIANDGIQSLTIKNLSKAVGVTEAALYRHYESKQSMLMTIIDHFEDFSKTDTDKVPSSPIEAVKYFLTSRYDKFISNPELSKVMFSEALFLNDKDISERMRLLIHGHKKELEAIIESGKKKGLIRNDIDTRSLFRMIVGSMRLLVTQWCFNDYSFDLKAEGLILWNNIELMINNEVKE